MPAKSQACSCGTPISARTAARTGLCVVCYKAALQTRPVSASAPMPISSGVLIRGVSVAQKSPPVPADQVKADRQLRQVQADLADVRAKYKSALATIDKHEAQIGANTVLEEGRDTFTITPKHGSGTSEATAVIVASDWHIEETVGNEVGGLNTYTLDIAERRAVTFFQSALRLVNLLKQDVAIPTIVLALLGDFITNAEMHGGDNAESCSLPPTLALAKAQNLLLSGIDFLLAHTDAAFTIVCHSGNHARTTHKTRFSAENGHSLEYLMYLTLAKVYRDNPRITFIIPEGMHSYVQVYDQMIRFQHGHAIKYGGGVGGIYVPVNKAIAQWDRAKRADLNIFGHFHQQIDGGNFVCNGSLIGYNAFALSIKASFEKPKQTLLLIDKKRGRTCLWPIFVS
jgi:hypothetical protein